jgi:hypothetical protein
MADVDPRLHALAAALDGGVSVHDLAGGVIRHIRVPFPAYLDHASEIFSLLPLRHLSLYGGTSADVARLFRSPEIAPLKSILIEKAPVGDAELEILALSPHPTELRWLTFYEGAVSFAGFRSVAESLSLRRLVHLAPGRGSDDPRKSYYTDWDGSIADSHFPETGVLLERWYGPVPWLLPTGPDAPDRFQV